ncbi:MAG: SMP-30/gluconolactonase/LRE family protein [Actinomycetota bacterium]
MTRELTLVRSGIDFGEGPRWHDGKLWFSDFYRHGVFTLDADGTETRVVTVDQQPSGLGWMPDGTMLIVSMLDHKVLALGADGELREHADLSGVATGKCNDMVVAADGTAYVGNFGFDMDGGADFAVATLAGVRPDGSVFAAASDLRFPNGSVITPDGSTLIVGETFGSRYTAFTIADDGSLSDRRVWAKIERSFPDGCCLDAQGAIWMSDVSNRRFCRVHEGGEISETIEVDQLAVACMLGGDDGRTLHLLISPGAAPEDVDGRAGSVIMTTRVDVEAAGLP